MITMKEAADAVGIGVPVLRFLLAFFASIPCSWLWRFAPSVQARHLYAAASGAILSYWAFGAQCNIYFLLPIFASYTAMILDRRHCGIVTFILAFGILVFCHVIFMSGDAWKKGGIDSTGAMMVVTLKVTSAAFNYQDGLIEDEKNLRASQRSYRLSKLPSFLAFLGYCFNCGTHLAGPVFELKDYMDWTENEGLWSPLAQKKPPSPYKETFITIIKAFVYMGIHLYMSGAFPLSYTLTPEYLEWGFWHRAFYQYLAGLTARWKYYFVWSLSEAAVLISGFGFSGWTKDPEKESKPKWTRAKNIDVLNVEFATSAAEIPKYWNIHVSVWLRYYVYERLVVPGQKPGFWQLLATQVTSAVWHGLYAGYMLFFVNTSLMIAGSRVIYKWQQAIPKNNSPAVVLGKLFGAFYTAFVLNLTCMGFLVLYYADTLAVYKSVYYAGTLLPLALMILGKFVRPPRAAPKAKKES